MSNAGIPYLEFPTSVSEYGIFPTVWQPSCLHDANYDGFIRHSIQIESGKYSHNMNWWLAHTPIYCVTPPLAKDHLMYTRCNHTLPINGTYVLEDTQALCLNDKYHYVHSNHHFKALEEYTDLSSFYKHDHIEKYYGSSLLSAPKVTHKELTAAIDAAAKSKADSTSMVSLLLSLGTTKSYASVAAASTTGQHVTVQDQSTQQSLTQEISTQEISNQESSMDIDTPAVVPSKAIPFNHHYRSQILENFKQAPIPEVPEPPTRMVVPVCCCKGIIYRCLLPNNVILSMDESINKWCPLPILQVEIPLKTDLAPGDPQPIRPQLHAQAQCFINKATDDFRPVWRRN